MSNSNQRRIFDEIIALNAWDSGSDTDHARKIHVDISFLTARLGQEENCAVNFRVRLAQAELIFEVPRLEPVKVIQNSVLREPIATGQISEELSSEHASKTGLAASVATNAGTGLGFSAGANKSSNTSHKSQLTYTKSHVTISWKQSTTASGQYKWAFQPSRMDALDGKPWDPVSSPILSVLPDQEYSPIPASCRLKVRCKKEDLIISDIKAKGSRYIGILEISPEANRIAAAEALIKNILARSSLETKDFNDRFGDVELADVMIESGVEE